MLPKDYEEAPGSPEEGYEFDWRVTITGTQANLFRIFMEGGMCNDLPDLRIGPSNTTSITVAMDGSCIDNGTANAQAGAGIYVEGEETLKTTIQMLATLPQTNQVGEAITSKELAAMVNKRAILHMDTDSQYVLKHLTSSLRRMEDLGYIEVPNRGILQEMVASFCSQKQISTMKWVKEHNGHRGNEEADHLANEGAQKNEADSISLNIHPTIRITGAALSKMTQSCAYKAL